MTMAPYLPDYYPVKFGRPIRWDKNGSALPVNSARIIRPNPGQVLVFDISLSAESSSLTGLFIRADRFPQNLLRLRDAANKFHDRGKSGP
jgi:hypothetical protein